MAFPLGVTVTARTTPPTGGIPTATDTWFVLADTDVGDDTVATQVSDLADFENQFGPRLAGNIALWDALDVYFREGGKRAYIAVGTDATALDQFTEQLGPGQLSAIGGTPDDTLFEMLWTHAADHNRVVIGDVPGPRVDETGNPNQAAAGRQWPLQYVVDFTQTFTDVDRADLLDAGVNLFANIYGVLENYGFQTTVDQRDDNPFWQLNCSRMRMALVANAQAIGENFMFRPIDGRGILASSLADGLNAMLLGYYSVNALYGDSPLDAFDVNVGQSVNTIESIAQGTLRAVATVVLTLHAKAIQIELVTVPVGGTV
jgi:hypothetical protein